nr:hypothetical protein [uncultured Macellibacteroides sp.]
MLKKNLEFKMGNGTVKILTTGFTSAQSARLSDAVEKMTECIVLSSRPGCVFVQLKKGSNIDSFTDLVSKKYEELLNN